jgi:hypothetical protein
LDAFNDVEASDTPVVPVETPKETPAEEKPIEDTPVEEKPIEDKPKEEAVEAPAESTLPAAYVRSAKARGWTDSEIADAVKLNSDKALQTFERMHVSRTQEINEWAELGRKVRQTPIQVATPVVPSAAATASPAASAPLTPINVDEMIAKYGNEDIIRALAGPVNAAIAAVAPLVDQATRAQTEAKETAREQLGKAVESFFTDKTMAPFTETYGSMKKGFTAPQIEMRSKVLEMADALRSGARYQGRELSVQDALMLAHDSVTSGMKEQVIRDQLRQKVTKRATSITLAPTATGRAKVGGPPKDRQELVSRTEDRLAAAFGR